MTREAHAVTRELGVRHGAWSTSVVTRGTSVVTCEACAVKRELGVRRKASVAQRGARHG